LKLRCLSSLMQWYSIFPWLWKRSQIWFLYFHIYNNGGWRYGIHTFSRISSVKMAFGEPNLGSNKSGARRLSCGFCACIPIIQFHSIFNLLQIDLWVFVSRHTYFYITIKLPLVSTPRTRKLVVGGNDLL
jgi:hypothetical protein